MLQRRVSVRPRVDQPVFSFAIAGLSCCLSLWLTLKFCRQLWPQEGVLALLALGVTWELAKVHFGPIGLRGLGHGRPGRRFASAMLLAMTLVLMAGSVTASMAYFSQADSRDQVAARSSSQAYQDALAVVDGIDRQVAILTAVAAGDIAGNFRKRALGTSAEISTLRREREAAARAVLEMETHPVAASGDAFFATVGALWGGNADANAARIRHASHLAVAVMLELIGVASMCLAQMQRDAAIRQYPDAAQQASGSRDTLSLESPAFLRRATSTRWRQRPCAFVYRPDATTDAPGQMHPEPMPGYAEAKLLVTQAKVPPTYRALQNALSVGQATSQRFLAAMQAEGLLHKVGRRYQRVA